eukprot:Sspe_Gene.51575::Locus_28627_Transcript_2_6_Confidence_0.375_Length_899::g.51575::m.51575/K12868/SYF2; pre-mRNA-splicing factor SYF2
MAEDGEIDLESEDVKEPQAPQPQVEEESTDPAEMRKRRLENLRLMMNKTRNLNKEAAKDEYRRETEGEAAAEARRRKQYMQEKKKQEQAEAAEGLVDPTRAHLHVTAAQAAERTKKEKRKKANEAPMGWDMFNVDTQVKTYKKRVQRVHEAFGKDLKDEVEEGKERGDDMHPDVDTNLEFGEAKVTEAMRIRLRAELEAQEKRRASFSRRRAHNEDYDIDYINERNKVFNEKLRRHFDKYTVEIRQNLERGTAL